MPRVIGELSTVLVRLDQLRQPLQLLSRKELWNYIEWDAEHDRLAPTNKAAPIPIGIPPPPDGEPSDVDVPDHQYLAEDARRVVQQLRRRGIDTFAFGISNGPFSQLDRIFGERRALWVPRIEVLPQRLVQLYRELKK